MWDKQIWVPWRKHRPLPNEPWARQVAWTKNDDARYAPGVSIQELELSCVSDKYAMPPDKRKNVRMYVRDCGTIVGASEGEETTLVYVEWTSDGSVHGRPITKKEEKNKLQVRRRKQ